MANLPPWLRPDRGIFPLSEVAERSARDFGNRPAMRAWTGDGYREISYTEFRDQVYAVARWLVDRGISPGDRVAMLGENSPEWGISYYGAVTAGAVAVPIDRLLPVSSVRHILADSGSHVLFAQPRHIEQLLEAAPVRGLETMVSLTDETPEEDVIAWSTVLEEGGASGASLPKRDVDDLLEILYTSGTTGTSKGVMLTHRNVIKDAAMAGQAVHVGPGDMFLSLLPMHHAYENSLGLTAPLYTGSAITYARSLKSKDLIADISSSKVTIMCAVPLLYEKMHDGILKNVKKKGLVARAAFGLLYGLSDLGWKLGVRLGHVLFRSIREKAGLGSMKIFICGGGPLNPETSRFFNNFGIWLLQGYGLTETGPMTHYNYPQVRGIRHECVGMPYPDVECKLANPDENGVGEVCIKGPIVFKGYYKNEEATRETFDEEGWFHTGDLGIIYPDNYLQITGRKKNLIVTGGGKNVYPEEIEHELNQSPFIAESLVIGIQRSSGYGEQVAALIVPDYEQVDLFFEKGGTTPEEKDLYNRIKHEITKLEEGIRREVGKVIGKPFENLSQATEQDVYELIRQELRRIQKEFPEFKRIKQFRIMEDEFQKTSTRKIKRFLYSGEMLQVNGQKV